MAVPDDARTTLHHLHSLPSSRTGRCILSSPSTPGYSYVHASLATGELLQLLCGRGRGETATGIVWLRGTPAPGRSPVNALHTGWRTILRTTLGVPCVAGQTGGLSWRRAIAPPTRRLSLYSRQGGFTTASDKDKVELLYNLLSAEMLVAALTETHHSWLRSVITTMVTQAYGERLLRVLDIRGGIEPDQVRLQTLQHSSRG